MTINTLYTCAVSPSDLLDYMQDSAELVLERTFSVSTEDANVIMLSKDNKAVMFASVYFAYDDGKPCLDVQVSTVLNADLDCDTASTICTSVQAAAMWIREQFEAKINQIISQY